MNAAFRPPRSEFTIADDDVCCGVFDTAVRCVHACRALIGRGVRALGRPLPGILPQLNPQFVVCRVEHRFRRSSGWKLHLDPHALPQFAALSNYLQSFHCLSLSECSVPQAQPTMTISMVGSWLDYEAVQSTQVFRPILAY